MKNSFFLIFGITTMFLFVECKGKQENVKIENDNNTFVNRIRTAPVQNFQENDYVEVLGIVMSEQDSKPSFKTGGIIARTFAKEGDQVKQGQLLAILALDEINSQVQQAEEALSKADRDKKRVANLYRDSAATLEQFQNVGTAYEFAKKQADIAKFNRAYSEIRSPISGKIIKQILHAGEITGPGNPVFVILGTSDKDWIIKAGLIDRDWARVSLKDSVTIKLDAYPELEFVGYVSDLASMGVNASGTFDVEVKFLKLPKQLAAGLTAKLKIKSKHAASSKIIPSDALIKSNGSTAYVFINDQGVAKRLKLNISRLLGEYVEINSGLEGISEVITTGAMYLEEGDPVSK